MALSTNKAEEALAIAERCEYRLAQADIHNFLAHEAIEAGDRRTAEKHAEIAYEPAWCDGPPPLLQTGAGAGGEIVEGVGSATTEDDLTARALRAPGR
jgi:hypothetical protein